MADPLRYALAIPTLACRAYELAERGGFGVDGPGLSSRPGTGALLEVLTASRPRSSIAELGTGLGGATAWIAHGMDAPSHLVSVDVDPVRAEHARTLLEPDARVEVVTGRLDDVLPARGLFDLVFVDSGVSAELHNRETADLLLGIVVTGGLLVLDDLTPELELAGIAGIDSKREFALRNRRVIGAELYPPSLEGRSEESARVCW